MIKDILQKALEGGEVTKAEGEVLFSAGGEDLRAVCTTADTLRERAVGTRASFIVTRNINFTNVCYMGCRFCNFAKRMEDPDAELLSMDEVARRAQEAWDRGATEVCIQGGLHPKIKGDHYRNILLAIKAQVPGMHVHAFSPFELWYGSRLTKTPVEEFIADLKECGLGTIPGTAAEILDTEVRKQLTQDKLSAEEWVRIIKAAHGAGLRTTATIMYGHVDEPRHWAAHLDLIRSIQKETGGFTEFVPLGFVHYDSPLYTRFGARPGPTREENIRMHAVSRIMLNGWVDHVQVSWVKMGPEMAKNMLACGVDDLGGTLMNESISRAAGSPYGQEVTPREMVDLIRAAGRIPVRRNTLYDVVETYENHEPEACAPLVPRTMGRETLTA
jgi:FO synthase